MANEDTDWHRRLAEARSSADVLRIVKDYVASWKSTDIAALPEDCRVAVVNDVEDIAAYAVTLAQRQLSSPHSDELQSIVHVFTSASVRLVQLAAQTTLPRG
jgi:hypothetical protein